MIRSFTVALTEAEAATVWRMAELSGIPAGQIVQNLHRLHLFRLLVSLANNEWTFIAGPGQDPIGPDAQDRKFEDVTADLLGQIGLTWEGHEGVWRSEEP